MKEIDRSMTVKKWMPIIERHLHYKNNSINTLICFYCEWYTKDVYENSDLPDRLMEIKDKIDSYSRIEILGQFFNPASGIIEYKLKNGKFISAESQVDYELSDDELLEIFGIGFIRELDPQKFRDIQLDKLL